MTTPLSAQQLHTLADDCGLFRDGYLHVAPDGTTELSSTVLVFHDKPLLVAHTVTGVPTRHVLTVVLSEDEHVVLCAVGELTATEHEHITSSAADTSVTPNALPKRTWMLHCTTWDESDPHTAGHEWVPVPDQHTYHDLNDWAADGLAARGLVATRPSTART